MCLHWGLQGFLAVHTGSFRLCLNILFKKMMQPPMSTASPFGAMASLFAPKLPSGLAASLTIKPVKRQPSLTIKPVKRKRQAVRPPVEHKWSLPGVAQNAKPPAIFQHELIQSFSINMFCKILVNQVRTCTNLRSILMKRIFLSALHFRINTRYKAALVAYAADMFSTPAIFVKAVTDIADGEKPTAEKFLQNLIASFYMYGFLDASMHYTIHHCCMIFGDAI